jgi:galactokinase
MAADTEVNILGQPGDRDRLLSAPAMIDRLTAQGVGPAAAERFAQLLATAARALDGSGPSVALIAPGRIEVLGKHTDYCGGRSLLAAVEFGIAIVAQPRKDRHIRIRDVVLERTADYDFQSDLQPRAGEWTNYPMTVARRVARNFLGELCGADIAIASNLPAAAGMSSSSALVIGVFLALAAANRLDESPIWRACLRTREELAGYCGAIENGQNFGPLVGDKGVGTFGGSEDHVAVLCAVPGHLLQYSFSPIHREAVVPMPAGYTFVVMDSGVVAEKTGAALEKYGSSAEFVG